MGNMYLSDSKPTARLGFQRCVSHLFFIDEKVSLLNNRRADKNRESVS